jgi:hypothetical protein
MEKRIQAGDAEGAFHAAFDFARISEQLTLTARQMPAYTYYPQANKAIEQHISESVPIKIGFTAEKWFCVSIPALLPKKEKGSAEYIRDNLYIALKNFWRSREPVYFTDCYIVFRHVYGRDRPERLMRDHDNIELNMAIDAIALYVLIDDSALRCNHLYCSKAGDENRTEIFVVPQDEIVAWIKSSKSYDGKGVNLYD